MHIIQYIQNIFLSILMSWCKIQHGSLQLLNWKHNYLSFSTEKIIKRETFFFWTQLEHTVARSGRPRRLHRPVFHPFLHNEQNKNKPRTTALPRLTPIPTVRLHWKLSNCAFAEVSDIHLSTNSKLTSLYARIVFKYYTRNSKTYVTVSNSGNNSPQQWMKINPFM